MNETDSTCLVAASTDQVFYDPYSVTGDAAWDLEGTLFDGADGFGIGTSA